jgi:hypothetical protein
MGPKKPENQRKRLKIAETKIKVSYEDPTTDKVFL